MTVVLTVSAILFGVLAYFGLPVNDLPAVDYPGDPGAGGLSRRHARDDGEQRRHAARAAVHADPRAGAGHLQQQPGAHQLRRCSSTLDKSIDAAATDVQAAITQAHGTAAARSAQPADVHARPTRTISRSCTSRCTATRSPRASSTTTPTRRSASASAFCRGVSQVPVYGTQSAVRIKADPSALATRSMTMDDLATAIKNGTSYQGRGPVRRPAPHASCSSRKAS